MEGPVEEQVITRVMDYLAEHPEGKRIAEIETHLGLASPVLLSIIERLVRDGKVRREGQRYGVL